MKKILAIIPARGGSRGIPNKNLVTVGGKPLMVHSIEAALKSKYISRTFVSSDSEKILSVAKKAGAETIKRPKKFASSTAACELLVFHLLDYLKKRETYVPDILIYLQPTSPLRDHHDVDAAIKLFNQKKATALISVYEIEKKFLKMFLLDKNSMLTGAINNRFPFANRQQLPDAYLPNGAIHMATMKSFRTTGRFFSDRTVAFIMRGIKNVDIDGPEDLALIRAQFGKKKK